MKAQIVERNRKVGVRNARKWTLRNKCHIATEAMEASAPELAQLINYSKLFGRKTGPKESQPFLPRT